MHARFSLSKIAKSKGITEREAARQIGLSEKDMLLIESGKVRSLRLSTIATTCEKLDVEPSDFIELV